MDIMTNSNELQTLTHTVTFCQSTLDKLHYDISSLAGIKLTLEVLQASEKLTDDGTRELGKSIDYLETLSEKLRDLLCTIRSSP
jgi:hypothetical protein